MKEVEVTIQSGAFSERVRFEIPARAAGEPAMSAPQRQQLWDLGVWDDMLLSSMGTGQAAQIIARIQQARRRRRLLWDCATVVLIVAVVFGLALLLGIVNDPTLLRPVR